MVARAPTAASPAELYGRRRAARAPRALRRPPADAAHASSPSSTSEPTSLAEVALSASGDRRRPPRRRGRRRRPGSGAGYRNEVRGAMPRLAGTTVEARGLAVAEALDCSVAPRSTPGRRPSPPSAGPGGRGAGPHDRRLRLRDGIRLGAAGPRTRRLDPRPEPPPRHRRRHARQLAPPPGRRRRATRAVRDRPVQPARREAADVIEGVPPGQPIGALVGYQIERGLHEDGSPPPAQPAHDRPARGPPRCTTPRRSRSTKPSGRRRTSSTASPAAPVPTRQPSAPAPPLRRRLRQARRTPTSRRRPAVPTSEWGAVATALRGAAATLDAVADVMLSESSCSTPVGNPYARRGGDGRDGRRRGADDTVDVLGVRQPGRSLTHAMFCRSSRPPPRGLDDDAAAGPRRAPPRGVGGARTSATRGDIVLADAARARLTLAEAGFARPRPRLRRRPRRARPRPARRDPRSATRRSPSARRRLARRGTARSAAATLAATLRSIVAGGARWRPTTSCAPASPPSARSTSTAAGTLRRPARRARRRCSPTGGGRRGDRPRGRHRRGGRGRRLHDSRSPRWPPSASRSPRPRASRSTRVGLRGLERRRGPPRAARALLAQLAALPVTRTRAQLVDPARTSPPPCSATGSSSCPAPAARERRRLRRRAHRARCSPPPPPSRFSAFVRDVATVRRSPALSEALLLGRAPGSDPARRRAARRAEGGTGAPGTDRWLAGPLPTRVRGRPRPRPTSSSSCRRHAGRLRGASPASPRLLARAFRPGPARASRRRRAGRSAAGARARPGSPSTPTGVGAAAPGDPLRGLAGRPPLDHGCARRVVRAALDLAQARLVTLEKLPGEATILPAALRRQPVAAGPQGLRVHRAGGDHVGQGRLPLRLGGDLMAELKPVAMSRRRRPAPGAIADALDSSPAGADPARTPLGHRRPGARRRGAVADARG